MFAPVWPPQRFVNHNSCAPAMTSISPLHKQRRQLHQRRHGLCPQRGSRARYDGEPTAASAADANATNVTLSDEALALLAAQDTTKTFDAGNNRRARRARSTLQGRQRHGSARRVASRPSICPRSTGARCLPSPATARDKFTADEQTVASMELAAPLRCGHRAESLLHPISSGDYSASVSGRARLYRWRKRRGKNERRTGFRQNAALTQGLAATKRDPSVLTEPALTGDPIADLVAARRTAARIRAASPTLARWQTSVRTSLDQQYISAKRNGEELVFDRQRKNGPTRRPFRLRQPRALRHRLESGRSVFIDRDACRQGGTRCPHARDHAAGVSSRNRAPTRVNSATAC